MSPKPLFAGPGGSIERPTRVLCDRADGGHLIVNPPRPVWERSELTALELAQWGWLVAATGRAMLDVLPVLAGGCLNYWEAGNWALNDAAPPAGAKRVQDHRRVHLHLFGRSRTAGHADWAWGESPRFPTYADSAAWAAQFAPLDDSECAAVVARAVQLLDTVYRLP
jgi:diadenosine tetraphosphate (Ap4A) HIT family hydrolase